ncbi:uncharacterized protein LOC142340162 isoform X2 [Convolutriloba macropyga]|uniref:uncharacterized protein LOC142340162 isoform X2 n=1 Tax=Convolutriloba macropyga TaxID=536237 RepID=UPI003F528031
MSLRSRSGNRLGTMTPKVDIASLPTTSLLRLIDDSRYLRSEVTDDDSDSSTQRRLASDGGGRGGGGGLESSVEERSLIPYSAPVLLPKSTTSFRNGGGLHGNNFSAELEALDWTLKGDLLQLKKSYMCTFEEQQREIERLAVQLEQSEREVRAKRADCESLSLQMERRVNTLQRDMEHINVKNASSIKSITHSKDEEIANLTRSLEKSEAHVSQLMEQSRLMKGEMESRDHTSSAMIDSINNKIVSLTGQHEDELEKVRKLNSEKMEYELDKMRKSLTESHESEMNKVEKSSDMKRQQLEHNITELNGRIARQDTEHRSLMSKLKEDHERTLQTTISRERERTQSELHDLQRSLSNKHEYELDNLRRKLTNHNQELEDKNKKLEVEIERLKKRENDLVVEIENVKRKNREEILSQKEKLQSDSNTELQSLEKKLREKFEIEIKKVKDDKGKVEDDLKISEMKLADIKSKFVLLEETLQKMEERTISSIEKTSFKLVKALGLEDPRTDKSQSLSAALEYLRWTAKETINSIATNQTLVLDICDKWKTFEREKSDEVRRLREQFSHETEDLIEFSKQEIGESYRHNLATFRPIPQQPHTTSPHPRDHQQ